MGKNEGDQLQVCSNSSFHPSARGVVTPASFPFSTQVTTIQIDQVKMKEPVQKITDPKIPNLISKITFCRILAPRMCSGD